MRMQVVCPISIYKYIFAICNLSAQAIFQQASKKLFPNFIPLSKIRKQSERESERESARVNGRRMKATTRTTTKFRLFNLLSYCIDDDDDDYIKNTITTPITAATTSFFFFYYFYSNYYYFYKFHSHYE